MSLNSPRSARERYTIDRLREVAPDAIRAAEEAVLALPVKRGTSGMTSRQDKLKVLADLNSALAAAGIDPVTYSMLNGWAAAVRNGRPRYSTQ